MRHPPEDVGVAAKLRERAYLGVCSAEIAEEVADGSAAVAFRDGVQLRATRQHGRKNQPADVEAEVAVRDSRSISRQRPYVLGHEARVPEVDVLRSDLDIEQRGLDIGVAHQAHARWAAAAGPHLVCGNGGPPLRGRELSPHGRDTGLLAHWATPTHA